MSVVKMSQEEFNKRVDVLLGEVEIAARAYQMSHIETVGRTDIWVSFAFQSFTSNSYVFHLWWDRSTKEVRWGTE